MVITSPSLSVALDVSDDRAVGVGFCSRTRWVYEPPSYFVSGFNDWPPALELREAPDERRLATRYASETSGLPTLHLAGAQAEE